MKMAKASQQDLDQCLKLFRLFDVVESGDVPNPKWVENGDNSIDDPDRFDPENQIHLRIFYDMAMRAYSTVPSAFMRVVFGFQTLVDNDVFDPSKSYLELNPELFRDNKSDGVTPEEESLPCQL